MMKDSRKEMFEAALSKDKQQTAARTSKTAFQACIAPYRCCVTGDLKAARTNFVAAMNICLTTIVNPKAGANQKD